MDVRQGDSRTLSSTDSDIACHAEVVSLQDVSFAYEKKNVFEGLNFQILQRDFVGLIGANGAGKSTLLKMIVGLLQPTTGEVRLFGTKATQFKDWEKIGYVPQRKTLNPLFPATVREVVMSGLYSRRNMFRLMAKKDRQRCDDALEALGIASLASRKIGQLSGGQQQRTLLARALVSNPSLLILDEPMEGIDAETQVAFFDMLMHLHQHHDITLVMVSHDIDMMVAYLGNKPTDEHGKLKFYVKHSHALQECTETDLTHGLKQYYEMRPAIAEESVYS